MSASGGHGRGPEPHAPGLTGAAQPELAAAPVPLPAARTRYRGMILPLGIIAVIATVAALYLARAFLVPLLIGMLASYTLRPVVDWLQARRVPRPAGAAMALIVLVGSLSWVGYSLSDDAAAMIERLPEAARKLRQTMSEARRGDPGTGTGASSGGANSPLQNMQEAAKEIEGAAADASQKPGTPVTRARAPEATVWLRDYAMVQSGLLIGVAAQAPIVLLLAYFLLASGVHFRRKLVHFVGPSLSRKKDAVRILEEIDSQIQRFLFSTLVSNTLLAIGTWLAFAALGVENAAVWGAAAGILHFIPYLGSALLIGGSGVAGFLQTGSVVDGLVIAGAALAVAAAIGLVLQTWLQSRAASVNAAVLFIALLFFAWLWGIWGLLLGAPIVAIVKVICDRVDDLKPIGELLGR